MVDGTTCYSQATSKPRPATKSSWIKIPYKPIQSKLSRLLFLDYPVQTIQLVIFIKNIFYALTLLY